MRAALPHIHSLGVIAAIGDTCMFERVPDKPFEWIAPPEASFLEISDWGLDEAVIADIGKLLGARYRVQTVAVSEQDFDTWTRASLARHIRELALPEAPIDAYLLVLRDWRADGHSNHRVGGLGLYRLDIGGGKAKFGVFASYRVMLANPDTGEIIAEAPGLLPKARLPWRAATRALWPSSQNELTGVQRGALRADFLDMIDATLPHALKSLGLRTR